MFKVKRVGLFFFGWITVGCLTCCNVSAAPATPAGLRVMPTKIEQFTADRMSLTRLYPVAFAPARMARFQRFYDEQSAALATVNFDKLPEDDRVDYLLLKHLISA